MINQQISFPYQMEVTQPANNGYNINYTTQALNNYGFEQNISEAENNFPFEQINSGNAKTGQNNYNDVNPTLDAYIRESIEPVEDEQVKPSPYNQNKIVENTGFSNNNTTINNSSTQAINLMDFQPKNDYANNEIYYNNQQIENVETQIIPSTHEIPTQQLDNELLYNFPTQAQATIENNVVFPQVQTPTIENNVVIPQVQTPTIENNVVFPQVQTPTIENNVVFPQVQTPIIENNIIQAPQTQVFDNNAFLSLQNTTPKVQITNLTQVPNINTTINNVENETLIYTPQNQALSLPTPTIITEPNPIIVKVPKTLVVPKVNNIIVPTKQIIYVKRDNASFPTLLNNTMQMPTAYPSTTMNAYTPTLTQSAIVYNTSSQIPIMPNVTPNILVQNSFPSMVQSHYNSNTFNPMMSSSAISTNVGVSAPAILNNNIYNNVISNQHIGSGKYTSRTYNARKL